MAKPKPFMEYVFNLDKILKMCEEGKKSGATTVSVTLSFTIDPITKQFIGHIDAAATGGGTSSLTAASSSTSTNPVPGCPTPPGCPT